MTLEISREWEILPNENPRRLAKKRNGRLREFINFLRFSRNRFPVQVLFRFVKEAWLKPEYNKFKFPFKSMPIQSHYVLEEGWHISRGDRKYLYDGPLYHSNGRTVLVRERVRWWETNATQIVFLIAAIIAIISAIIAKCR